MNKENLSNNGDESDEEIIGNLSDSDVDEIENQLLKAQIQDESEEYSDDENIYPVRDANKNNNHLSKKNLNYLSDEYSDDDALYPKTLSELSIQPNKKHDEEWVFVQPGTDKNKKNAHEFKEKSGPTFSLSLPVSPSVFYQELLPDSLFDHLVTCTNTRARVYFEHKSVSSPSQKTWKSVTRDEMKKFVAIVIQMGMIRKRSIREYWSTNPYIVTPIFHSPEYLSRDRFSFILRFLRFANCESLVPNDRLQRIRPFIDQVRDLCQRKYIPSRHVAVDESLMLYKGRLAFKQYNPRKRARFGIKIFALCDSSNGYLFNFEIYTGQGTDSWANKFPDARSLPVSERIVIHLADQLLEKNYCLYADNWFLSTRLARWLVDHQTTTTGTIKKNRGVPKDLVQQQLTAPNSSFMRCNDLLMIKFVDKKATGDKEIYVIDSKGVANITEVDRFEKGGVKRRVSKPSSIIDYNRHMGGVDLSDSSLHHTSVDRKSYRWFVKLGFHFFSRLLYNAFVMYRCYEPKATFSSFLLSFVQETMESTGIGRRSLNNCTPPQKRVLTTHNDNSSKIAKIQHFSSKTQYDDNRQGHVQKRCALCRSKNIRKQTIYFCRTCPSSPGFCYPDCFDEFHRNEFM